MRKKILKLMMAVILLLPLTMLSACSSKPDGKELMKEIVQEMKDVKSMKMEMDMVMKMKLSMGGSNLSMSMDANMDMDIINEPIAYYANTELNMEFLNQKEMTTSQMYLISEDDQLIQYINEGEGWSVTNNNLDIKELENLYKVSDKLIEQLDIKVKDGEKIDDKDTYQLDVTMKEDALKSIFENSMDEDSLSALGLSKFNLKYSVIVAKDNKRVLKISMDLKDNFSTLISETMMKEEIPEGSEISFDEMSLELSFSDYNKIDEVEVPEEVVNEAVGAITKGDISTQTHAWETYIVNVDGVDVTLGTTSLKTLLDLGYTIDNRYSEVKEELEEYDFEFITLNKGESSINVSVDNKKDTTIQLQDGVITSITNDSTLNQIVLPNHIKVGSTQEEVQAAYGQANEMNTQYIESWEYIVDGDVYASLNINFTDGVVSDFSISIY